MDLVIRSPSPLHLESPPISTKANFSISYLLQEAGPGPGPAPDQPLPIQLPVISAAVPPSPPQGQDLSTPLKRHDWTQCTRFNPPKVHRTCKKMTSDSSPTDSEGVSPPTGTGTGTAPPSGEKKGGSRKLGRNPRVPFSTTQVAVLEQKYQMKQYLSSIDVAELSALLSLNESRVKIWFQNRRARARKEQEMVKLIGVGAGAAPGVGSVPPGAPSQLTLGLSPPNVSAGKLPQSPISNLGSDLLISGTAAGTAGAAAASHNPWPAFDTSRINALLRNAALANKNSSILGGSVGSPNGSSPFQNSPVTTIAHYPSVRDRNMGAGNNLLAGFVQHLQIQTSNNSGMY